MLVDLTEEEYVNLYYKLPWYQVHGSIYDSSCNNFYVADINSDDENLCNKIIECINGDSDDMFGNDLYIKNSGSFLYIERNGKEFIEMKGFGHIYKMKNSDWQKADEVNNNILKFIFRKLGGHREP